MTKDVNYKVLCTECDWQGMSGDRPSAPNPFDVDDTIYGCPGCKSVDHFRCACDAPDCWEPVTCGITIEGVRHTVCGVHFRQIESKPKPV